MTTLKRIAASVLAIMLLTIASQANAGTRIVTSLRSGMTNRILPHTSGKFTYSTGVVHNNYRPAYTRPVYTRPAPVSRRPNLGMNVNGQLIVNQITPGSLAHQAGMRIGNQVLKFNGRSVRTYARLSSLYENSTGPVPLTVRTNTGRVRDVIFYKRSTANPSPNKDAKLVKLMHQFERVNQMRVRSGLRRITFKAFLAAKNTAVNTHYGIN